MTTQQPCCNHATCIYLKHPGTLNDPHISDASSTILGVNTWKIEVICAAWVLGFNIKSNISMGTARNTIGQHLGTLWECSHRFCAHTATNHNLCTWRGHTPYPTDSVGAWMPCQWQVFFCMWSTSWNLWYILHSIYILHNIYYIIYIYYIDILHSIYIYW